MSLDNILITYHELKQNLASNGLIHVNDKVMHATCGLVIYSLTSSYLSKKINHKYSHEIGIATAFALQTMNEISDLYCGGSLSETLKDYSWTMLPILGMYAGMKYFENRKEKKVNNV